MSIYLVVLISTISQIGFGGSRVAVSLYALELGANQFTVGVLVALYSLSPMFLSIVIGRVSDRVSPHLPMILGSVMMMVALLIPVAAPGIAMLCVLAFLNGLGHLIFSIPLEAAVGGVGGPQHRARNYALITMGWSIANFLGPLMSGILIDTIGNQRVFWVLALLVALPIPPSRRMIKARARPTKACSICGAFRRCALPSSPVRSSVQHRTCFSFTCPYTATRWGCRLRPSARCWAWWRWRPL